MMTCCAKLAALILAFTLTGPGSGVRFTVRHEHFCNPPTGALIYVPGRVSGTYQEIGDEDAFKAYRQSRFYKPEYVIYHQAFDLSGMEHAVYLPSLEAWTKDWSDL